MEEDDEVVVSIAADLAPFRNALGELSVLAEDFGARLGGALKSAAIDGKNLDEVLRRIGMSLAGQALNMGLKPLESAVGTFLSGALRALPVPRAAFPGG